MPELPRISIVTPSFNQAAFLEATIRSVLGQGEPRLEYLVVDGGSTDGSVEIIRKYADRLAWWVSEPDSGQAQAINKGLQRAQGEIVAWLNSDDLYLPGAFAAVLRFFDAHPEVGMLHGDVLAIDAAGHELNRLRYGNWGLAGLMEFRIIGQPAVFMRRSMLELAGLLDPSYHYLLDHHLWLRVAQQAPMQYLPELLAAARYHAQAKNLTGAAAFAPEIGRIAEWMENEPALAERAAANRRRITAGMHSLNGFYLVEANQPGKALGEYGRTFAAHPPTALRAWRRVIAALAGVLGLGALRQWVLALRRRRKHT